MELVGGVTGPGCGRGHRTGLWAGSGPGFLSPRDLVLDRVEVHGGSRGFEC